MGDVGFGRGGGQILMNRRPRIGEFELHLEKKSIPTFKLFAEGYMDTYSAMNHKPSTHDSYRSALDMNLLS